MLVLQGLPNVIRYLDDIIISGTSDAEHLSSLARVLDRLQAHGFQLRQDKCVFLADTVECLGHRIDAKGLHKTSGKLEAIREAPTYTPECHTAAIFSGTPELFIMASS